MSLLRPFYIISFFCSFATGHLLSMEDDLEKLIQTMEAQSISKERPSIPQLNTRNLRGATNEKKKKKKKKKIAQKTHSSKASSADAIVEDALRAHHPSKDCFCCRLTSRADARSKLRANLKAKKNQRNGIIETGTNEKECSCSICIANQKLKKLANGLTQSIFSNGFDILCHYCNTRHHVGPDGDTFCEQFSQELEQQNTHRKKD